MKKVLIFTVIIGLYPAMVLGEESTHQECESVNAKIKVDRMGMVDEDTLKQHMEKTRERMEAVRRSQPRSGLRRRLMREHLAEMRDAMEQLHNTMLQQGCYNSAHGASMEVRMEVMERRMLSMQQMLDQMLGHISELEKE
jgi:hypothetical protein